jgi:predicted nucleotidyltransferase/predicted transcriptional regulator
VPPCVLDVICHSLQPRFQSCLPWELADAAQVVKHQDERLRIVEHTFSPMQKRRQLMLNMHQSLSAVLFPGYRRRVLGMLLLHPEESLHGREIARRTGLPAGTLTRELKRLADVGLLNRQRRGNQLVYSANRDSPIFEELAGILRKTSGLADVVAEALERLTDRVDVAFIFGSVARAAETQGSDVDVLIIGSIDFGTVVDALHTAQQRLARDINPKVFSARE